MSGLYVISQGATAQRVLTLLAKQTLPIFIAIFTNNEVDESSSQSFGYFFIKKPGPRHKLKM